MNVLRRLLGPASLLLVMVAVTHMAYQPIGDLYADPVRAGKAWASVFRAFPEATLLYMLVWLMTPWRPLATRYGVSMACAWGMLESFQIAACRLQFPMDQAPPDVKAYTGLCDIVTGKPIYMLTVGVVIGALITFLTRPRVR